MKNSTKLKKSLVLLYQYTVAVIVVWILITAGSLYWNVYNERQSIQTMAKKEARSSFKKDEAFRLWIASRGGVYVPLDEKTPSNPYLKHPNRDITTKSGKNLTLMNAAYVFSKVMEEYGSLTGVKWRLTSLKPMNHANAPDEWERKTLLAFEQDAKEIFGFADINGAPHLRLLSPLVTKEFCLKCHAYQGYKVGDIRGAVGVSLPMATYQSIERKGINTHIWTHGIIMLLGLVAIGFVSRSFQKRIPESIRQEEELEKHRDHLEELVKERTAELRQEITEREKAEEALRESEDRFRSLFEQSNDAIIIHDIDGRILNVNYRALEMLGYDRKQLLGMNIPELHPASELETSEAAFKGIYTKGHTQFESKFTRSDGSIVEVEISSSITDKKQGVVQGIIRDITQRKKAEDNQRFSFEILEILNSQDETSETIVEILKLIKLKTESEAVGIRIEEGEDYPYYFYEGFPESIIKRENFLCERGIDSFPIRDPDGKLALECMCGNILRGRTDPALPFFTEGGSFWANSTTELLKNTTEEDRQARTRNYCNQADYESVAIIPLKAGEKIIGALQFNDKRKNQFSEDMIKFYESLGHSIGIAINKMKGEETLRVSEERYRTALETNPAPVIVYDLTGKVLYFNPAFTHVFGWTLEERVGEKMDDFVPDEAWPLTQKMIEKLISGESFSGIETLRYSKAGNMLHVSISGAAFRDPSGTPVGSVVNIRDISLQKKLEDQLRQAHKMEAIGTLAGGIAHDFNNILSPIMIHSEMAMMDLPPESPLQQSVQQIYKAGERARDLVKQILTFARRQEKDRIPLKVSQILKEAIKLLRSTLPTTIDIQYDINSEQDTVLSDPTQLNQIIMNLCTNAAHAMEENGGTLGIILTNENLDSESANEFPDLEPGRYVKLSVRDTGHGIDPQFMDKVFEPYFTTKEVGKGTGMGLALVHGIVKSCGGGITVQSEVGKGTGFLVYLPLVEDDMDVLETVKDTVQLPKGTERILFVDDEKAGVDAIQLMLESLSYKVTARTSSIEALEAFRNNPDAFDVIITDMTMPNMTGKELAKEIMSIRQDIPIILCTGFSDQIDERRAKLMGINAFVMKPIVMRKIANTIREVLDKEMIFARV